MKARSRIPGCLCWGFRIHEGAEEITRDAIKSVEEGGKRPMRWTVSTVPLFGGAERVDKPLLCSYRAAFTTAGAPTKQ